MSRLSDSPTRRRQTALALHDFTPPEQEELRAISNALDAALGYSPVRSAPATASDAYAVVTRYIEQRFWDEIFVARPEMRQILLELDKGLIVVITGERGTGKTTAIHAAMRELRPSDNGASPSHLSYIFDANQYAADLETQSAATQTIHETIYATLYDQALRTPERMSQWLAHLYRRGQAFEALRMAVAQYQLRPADWEDWDAIAAMPEYTALVQEGYRAFASESPSARLRQLLSFLHEATDCEILLVIDNLDHLSNAVQCLCARELFTVLASSPERIRGAIAVRPENFDRIQSELDTAARPPRVALAQKPWLHQVLSKPSASLTMDFISRRLAVVSDPDILSQVMESIPTEKVAALAAETGLPGATDPSSYLAVVTRVLDYMVYDVFRGDETDADLAHDNRSFVQYFHLWHNGSLRECSRSLVVVVEDILQNATHMYRLPDLMRTVIESEREPEQAQRVRLRRVTRSLLYRHLLFWGSHDGENPPANVMLFDAVEEETSPPLHFLRLRLLQYLANCERRPTVGQLQSAFARLGVAPERVSQALRELAVRRTRDDSGLIRIDDAPPEPDVILPSSCSVELLDPGRFLVTKLCMSTEYLFWSAVSPRITQKRAGTPARLTTDDVQRDSFRSKVAANFLEHDVVARLKDEHPYLAGPVGKWTPAKARERLLLYERLFGFRRKAWFLDQCCKVLYGFIPKHDHDPEWEEARASIARVRRFTATLDRIGSPAD
jgi:energy-coupling factor transporter ATP-binding protein EcfA2